MLPTNRINREIMYLFWALISWSLKCIYYNNCFILSVLRKSKVTWSSEHKYKPGKLQGPVQETKLPLIASSYFPETPPNTDEKMVARFFLEAPKGQCKWNLGETVWRERRDIQKEGNISISTSAYQHEHTSSSYLCTARQLWSSPKPHASQQLRHAICHHYTVYHHHSWWSLPLQTPEGNERVSEWMNKCLNKNTYTEWGKLGLPLWVYKTRFVLVLPFINYYTIFHMNNCKSTLNRTCLWNKNILQVRLHFDELYSSDR